MVNILAIETATEACSAALLGGERLVRRFQLLPQGHSREILAMCETVMAEAGVSIGELDAVAFGCGPGSFTGLRIAASVTQGLATGAGCGVIPVSTLAALAYAVDAPRVLAALDARMGEVYSGFYIRAGDGLMRLAGEERVGKPDALIDTENQEWVGVGSGFAEYDDVFASSSIQFVNVIEDVYPDAEHVARLALEQFKGGGYLLPAAAIPVYLRDNVAKKSVMRK